MEKWLMDDKLQCSEALGDLIMHHNNVGLALDVYLGAKIHSKAIRCFVQRAEYEKIVPYATSVGFRMDYSGMLSQLVFNNPQGALDLAKRLVSAEGGPWIDIRQTAEAFLRSNRIQETTAFLLEALKDGNEEYADLQTRLLQINLIGGASQVADAIIQQGMLTHYDRPSVAILCEKAGLWQRAAELYNNMADIERVFKFSHQMSSDFVVEFFGKLNRDQSISLLKEMMKQAENLQVCVEVSKKYHQELGADTIIKAFEGKFAFSALFVFLGDIVSFSEDSKIHLKFIQTACRVGQFQVAERFCSESNSYVPEEVMEYLMEKNFDDPQPIISVCHRFNLTDELTGYLYLNNHHHHLEVYVTQLPALKSRQVIRKLFDLNAKEIFLKHILMALEGSCLVVDELVEIAEARNRLCLLQPWLEARIATGSTDTGLHNALGKIYVLLNRDPMKFLINNTIYDPKVLGRYCEERDSQLAFVAYKKGAGDCDDELIQSTKTYGLYSDLAKYLVERQDLDFWGKVFSNDVGKEKWDESFRRNLIDQIVEWALPESTSADEVSCTLKAFMAADLSEELIILLERIVLQSPGLSENKNLQKLMLSIGDRCFSEALYHAAQMLYIKINNNPMLALCHIRLEEYREAVTAAQKANNVSTWKHVCFACLRAEEFRLSATCGLEVIKYPEHADEVVNYYSDLGYFTQVVSLFEQGIGLKDAHTGIFTELGILYTNHVPEKIMEHCKVFFTKLNVSEVARACERARLWVPAVYLYTHDKQHDRAVKIMMEHANAWNNDIFLDTITQVRNKEIMYEAVNYYLTIHPTFFTDLMGVLEENLDHSRVVSQLRRTGDWALPLGEEYLKSVQKNNLSPVNEALNGLFVEDEDYEALRRSIDSFNNFNMVSLASKLATHELLEFRRISAYVYRRNKKWTQSIDLSKIDRMWKDCIDTANESGDKALIEDLLRFFCDSSEKECFCAALYTCYSHVSPGLAYELGWLYGYENVTKPYFIQIWDHVYEGSKIPSEQPQDVARSGEIGKKSDRSEDHQDLNSGKPPFHG